MGPHSFGQTLSSSTDLGQVVQKADITIQRIALFFLLILIHWIAIYPVDNVIQPLNNRRLNDLERAPKFRVGLGIVSLKHARADIHCISREGRLFCSVKIKLSYLMLGCKRVETESPTPKIVRLGLFKEFTISIYDVTSLVNHMFCLHHLHSCGSFSWIIQMLRLS